MRRLAVQKRNDGYSSKRDYQTITTKHTQKVAFTNKAISFTSYILGNDEAVEIFAIGGFINPNVPTELELTVNFDNRRVETRNFKLTDNWNRIGFCFDINAQNGSVVEITFKFSEATESSFWGMEFDRVTPPITEVDGSITDSLNQTHLSPETYYFTHDTSINLDFKDATDESYTLIAGIDIELKKCSYCARLLPLRSDQPGILSFHKHNAKISGHQNECRACKKWRINDTFNPTRTTDQLHESSVITRERKLLLQEPSILQEIKKRTGEGLKSQIWEKFNRSCFYCREPVALNDFQLDHTRPLAYLWPIDEYATCLCSKHNNQKKDKFPIEFYSEKQLVELSEITGLSLEKLSIRDVNEVQLQRVLNNLVHYSKEWDARTFNAIARKIIEVRPQIDLFTELKNLNENAYLEVMDELQDRPDSVDIK